MLFKKYIWIVLCVACVALVAVSALVLVPTDSTYRTVDATLKTLTNVPYQEHFEQNIDILFREEGIKGMVNRVTGDLASGRINMFVCHALAHDIGHYGGYVEYFEHLESELSKEVLSFCGSGFLHGVEGELANGEYPKNIENLYTFCKMAMPYEPFYHGCYHGAGHSFMENTINPDQAMKQCDQLITDENVTVEHCYRGVFSEYAEFVRDEGKDDTFILSYCSSLNTTLQPFCALELNGLGITQTSTLSEIEYALQVCASDEYAEAIRVGCVQSVAGIAADHIIGNHQEVIPSDFVKRLPLELFKAYIRGTNGTFTKHSDRYNKDTFCTAFTDTHQVEYCTDILFGVEPQ